MYVKFEILHEYLYVIMKTTDYILFDVFLEVYY